MFHVAIPLKSAVAHYSTGTQSWNPRRYRVVEVAAKSQAEALAFVEESEDVSGCSILIVADHGQAVGQFAGVK